MSDIDIDNPEQVAARGREVLLGILERMAVEAEVEAAQQDDKILLTIDSDETERLVGRRGQVIDALQHLVNKMVYRGRASARTLPIVVDADGYRERHVERLQSLARRMGDRAVESGRTVELDPMSAYDRRIVHLALAEDARVTTRSEGDGDDRHILVVPVPPAERDESAPAAE